MGKDQNYQVIARQFRPQTFVEVVGQDAIVTTLKNALRFQKLAHAYLFCGSRGTGKTTLARLLAKALNCHALTAEFEPCNACPSCAEITACHSLDVLEIDGASNRGIDDIRQINETVGYAPAMGRFKIYLIDEVHMLTKEAFNALLKTLEEPPPQVKFFFATTEPHKILPTILSRCQRFDLRRISSTLIEEKLTLIAKELNASVEKGALAFIARVSDGSLRDAESILDQMLCTSEGVLSLDIVTSTLGYLPSSYFFELDKAIKEGTHSFAFECAEKIYNSGKEISYFLEELLQHFRVHLASHLSSEKRSALCPFTQEQCLYFMDFLIAASQDFAKSSFKRVHLEMILLHLIRSRHRLPLDVIAKQLIALKDALEKNATPESNTTEIEVQEIDMQSAEPQQRARAEVEVEMKAETRAEAKAELRDYETLMRFAAVELEGTIIT
jgi:DNA polymerase III subunit gamma/tau